MTTEKTTINRESDMCTGRRSISNPITMPGLITNRSIASIDENRQPVVRQRDHIMGSVNSPSGRPAPDPAAGDTG